MTTLGFPLEASAAHGAARAYDIASIFREHGGFAWRALRRLGVGDSDCDDVCQDVFVTVAQKLGGFEARSSLRTWIYGICVRKASAYRRRAHRRHEVLSDAPPDAPVTRGPHEQLVDEQARALLDRALDALDDDKRAAFVLYEIEQLAMKDVAEALGCPLQTAYSRLHAAREQVQAHLRRATLGRCGA